MKTIITFLNQKTNQTFKFLLLISCLFNIKQSIIKAQCQAQFTYTIEALGQPAGVVEFENVSTNVTSSARYLWDFGDNYYGYQNNQTHQYNANGSYIVSLHINDSVANCVDVISYQIDITNITCSISPSITYQLDQNGVVHFGASVAAVANNTTTTLYNWDFGDGHVSNTPYYVSNTYSASGIYTVTLNVTDTSATGCSGSTSQTVNVIVANCNLQSDFSYTVNPNNQVIFQNLSSNTTSATTFFWNFGNGTYSSAENPTITYVANSGTFSPYYVVYLTASDSSYGFNCNSTISKYIYLNTACNASFNTLQQSVACWQFNNNSVGGGLNYFWDFGDGTTSTLSNPQHCYSDSNSQHNVKLVINGSNNCHDTTTVIITDTLAYNPTGCNAQFTYWLDTTSCQLHLNNLSNNSTSSQWMINTGFYTYNVYQTNPVITFTAASSINVTLYSYYAGQICDTAQQQVFVSPHCSSNPSGPNCNASFVLYQDSSNTSHYYAYNQSIGSNLSYLWEFGDGTTSNLQYPSHTYSNPGNYVICLTVSNSNCTSTYCDSNNVFRVSAANLMQSLTVVPSNLTGIKKIQKNIKIDLYPNPVTSVSTIVSDSEINEIEIIDISGKQVLLEKTIDQKEYTLNLGDIDSGCYIVKITSKDGTKAIKKIMKL